MAGTARMAHKPRILRALNTKEQLIAAELRRARRPLSAYELMERLSDQGVSAPVTVYRALARLTEAGLAHRVESMNAFVACTHGPHAANAVFAICEGCGAVVEFAEPQAVACLAEWAARNAFEVSKMTLELRGRCCTCASDPAPMQS
jgi:Fur family transcriptional regulator, zinc uptake regulator